MVENEDYHLKFVVFPNPFLSNHLLLTGILRDFETRQTSKIKNIDKIFHLTINIRYILKWNLSVWFLKCW